MKIKNINRVSCKRCVCGSWLAHWENFGGRKPRLCQAKGCNGTQVVGAHVQKACSSDDQWYICPLCEEHKQFKGILDISMAYGLVLADRQETCEKSL